MYRVQGCRPKGRPVGLMKYVDCVGVGVKLRVFSKAIWSSSRLCRFYSWTKEAATRRTGDKVRAIFPAITQCVGQYAVRIVL